MTLQTGLNEHRDACDHSRLRCRKRTQLDYRQMTKLLPLATYCNDGSPTPVPLGVCVSLLHVPGNYNTIPEVEAASSAVNLFSFARAHLPGPTRIVIIPQRTGLSSTMFEPASISVLLRSFHWHEIRSRSSPPQIVMSVRTSVGRQPSDAEKQPSIMNECHRVASYRVQSLVH